uniref:Uroplakin 3A n=1 Tax=Varanus komodoensis TaxID=61221 RepID=A0A8D2LUJ7_VARKO
LPPWAFKAPGSRRPASAGTPRTHAGAWQNSQVGGGMAGGAVYSATSRTSSTDNSSKPLDATFEQTAGGQRGPYRAAAFNVPNCASSPRLSDAADTTKASAILSQYLIRVGDNVACLSDPNFLEVCNPPLFKDTAYRFKYILVDRTTDVMKDQTLWSYPIKTKKCECVSWSGFYFLENYLVVKSSELVDMGRNGPNITSLITWHQLKGVRSIKWESV